MSTQNIERAGYARQLWFAYLGALASTAQAGSRLLSTLAKRGETVQARLSGQVKRKLSSAEREIAQGIEQTEKKARTTARKVVERLDVPGKKDLGKLRRKVEQAAEEVAEVMGEPVDSPAVIAATAPGEPVELSQLPSVSKTMAGKLERLGISTSAELLSACATPARRESLAEALGVTPATVLELAQQADLSRLDGVAETYLKLLQGSGVSTVKELAQRNPENLREALEAFNAERQLTERLPSQATLQGWIEQARSLPQVLTY